MTAPKKPPAPDDAPGLASAFAQLRKRAELRMEELRAVVARDQSKADTMRLVHELDVHQIELELQNEELLQSKDAMEAALEKYRDLYDFAPVGYLTLDREGAISEANLAAASLLGTDRASLLGRRLSNHFAPDDTSTLNAFLDKAAETRARETCELTPVRADGRTIALRLVAKLAGSGKEFRVVAADITEHQQAERDRLVMSKLESTGILAGGIAHDFNNLLMVVLLSLEQAQVLGISSEDFSTNLDDAKAAIRTARGLTQQLITFAQGGAPIRKPTRLPAVIQEFARAAVSGSRARCEFFFPKDLWLVEADEGLIGQVTRNIVLNAREAMPAGGVISVRVENIAQDALAVPALPPGNYVRLSIEDRGSGIPEEALPKIFDPYFSTKSRGSVKGMGLGLTICHAIVQKHDGAIVVASEPTKGTTFQVYLPASRKATAAENPGNGAMEQAVGRILVMEDEPVLGMLIETALHRMGHEVVTVADGQAAIEAYADAVKLRRPYALVILNLTVRAGLGGEETMAALLKLDPSVRAIITSGYVDHPVLLEPGRHGFKGALAKPFDGGKLRKILAEVMRA